MDLTLRQVRYFVAVADAGKVSLAGSALGVSQSAITESMQALEAEAGIKLVSRHSRGVNLTHEGYQFLSHARKILAMVSDTAQMLKNSNTNLKGAVRLGVPPTVAGYFLAMPLTRFQRVFPKIEVSVTELDRIEIERQLINGSLDVAILLASKLPDPKRIETRTMFSSRRRLWLAPSHRLMSAPEIRLADVTKEPYLLLTIDDNEETTSRNWRRHGLEPNVEFRTVSIEAVRSLVATGAGVTILSDLVYRPWSLDGDRIEAREIADEIPDLKISVAWRKKGKLGDCARRFRDFCLEGSDLQTNSRQSPNDQPSR